MRFQLTLAVLAGVVVADSINEDHFYIYASAPGTPLDKQFVGMGDVPNGHQSTPYYFLTPDPEKAQFGFHGGDIEGELLSPQNEPMGIAENFLFTDGNRLWALWKDGEIVLGGQLYACKGKDPAFPLDTNVIYGSEYYMPTPIFPDTDLTDTDITRTSTGGDSGASTTDVEPTDGSPTDGAPTDSSPTDSPTDGSPTDGTGPTDEIAPPSDVPPSATTPEVIPPLMHKREDAETGTVTDEFSGCTPITLYTLANLTDIGPPCTESACLPECTEHWCDVTPTPLPSCRTIYPECASGETCVLSFYVECDSSTVSPEPVPPTPLPSCLTICPECPSGETCTLLCDVVCDSSTVSPDVTPTPLPSCRTIYPDCASGETCILGFYEVCDSSTVSPEPVPPTPLPSCLTICPECPSGETCILLCDVVCDSSTVSPEPGTPSTSDSEVPPKPTDTDCPDCTKVPECPTCVKTVTDWVITCPSETTITITTCPQVDVCSPHTLVLPPGTHTVTGTAVVPAPSSKSTVVTSRTTGTTAGTASGTSPPAQSSEFEGGAPGIISLLNSVLGAFVFLMLLW